jgi:hypothetical protein
MRSMLYLMMENDNRWLSFKYINYTLIKSKSYYKIKKRYKDELDYYYIWRPSREP